MEECFECFNGCDCSVYIETQKGLDACIKAKAVISKYGIRREELDALITARDFTRGWLAKIN
jgi:hypothetical protein